MHPAAATGASNRMPTCCSTSMAGPYSSSLELAGADAESLRVLIDDDVSDRDRDARCARRVRARRRCCAKRFRTASSSNRFACRVAVRDDGAAAIYRDGILTIRLPLAAIQEHADRADRYPHDGQKDPRLMPKPDKTPEILGILPLQDAVLFPNTVIPLAVVKRPGIALVEEALREGKHDRSRRAQGQGHRRSRSRRSAPHRHDRHDPKDAQGSGRHAALHRRRRPGVPRRPVRRDRTVPRDDLHRAARHHARERSGRRDAAQPGHAVPEAARLSAASAARDGDGSQQHLRSEPADVLRRLDDASRDRRPSERSSKSATPPSGCASSRC